MSCQVALHPSALLPHFLSVRPHCALLTHEETSWRLVRKDSPDFLHTRRHTSRLESIRRIRARTSQFVDTDTRGGAHPPESASESSLQLASPSLLACAARARARAPPAPWQSQAPACMTAARSLRQQNKAWAARTALRVASKSRARGRGAPPHAERRAPSLPAPRTASHTEEQLLRWWQRREEIRDSGRNGRACAASRRRRRRA